MRLFSPTTDLTVGGKMFSVISFDGAVMPQNFKECIEFIGDYDEYDCKAKTIEYDDEDEYTFFLFDLPESRHKDCWFLI